MMNKNNKEYIAPYAEIVEVNLKALMLFSGGEQTFSSKDDVTTTYAQTDESKEW